MQKRQESVVNGSTGHPVQGAIVTVTTLLGVAATIYTADGTGLISGNTVTTDSNGRYYYYAADGRYTETITGSGIVSTVITDILLEDPVDGLAALSASGGSALIGFLPSGTGAIADTVQTRGRLEVFVTDYMSVADRALLLAGSIVDVNTAMDNARTWLVSLGGGKIRMPAGSYYLNNWRYRTGIVVEGDGEEATIIYQQAAANPAIYCLADVTTGQIHGAGLKAVHLVGHGSASSPVLKVSATSPYVVTNSSFEWAAGMLEGTSVGSVYNALEIVVGGANEVYGCSFKCRSITSTNTAFKTAGSYNKYDFVAAACAVSAIIDSSLSSLFTQVVTDGVQTYSGQNCVHLNDAVETIFGTGGVGYAIGYIGNNHVSLSPTIINVDPTDATASFYLGNAGSTIVSPRVYGSVNPVYPFDVSAVVSATIIGGNVQCTSKLEVFNPAASIAKVTFVGDVSSFYGGLSTIQNANTTGVGNVGGGEDTLITYSLPADVLTVNTRGVQIMAWGTTANNTNPKTVKLYFGSVIITTALTVSQVGTWRIVAEVFRTGTDAQDYVAQLNQGGTATIVDVEQGSLTEDDGATITIKCTGTVTDGGGGINNNDIVQQGMYVKVIQ